MSWLPIMIIIPFIFAIFIPILYKLFTPRIHTGWFVFPIPLLIFIYLLFYIPTVTSGEVITHTLPWIPSLGINFTTYVGWFIANF